MSKACKYCESTEHTPFYCYKKPRKPIKARSKPAGGVVKQKTVNLPSKAKKLSKKPVKRSKVVKDLDNIFSQYIRLRDDGKGCCTCGVKKDWKEMQACHYITRGKLPTRWDETNVHSGCYRCNVLLKGNYTEYAIFMVQKYGADKLLELKQKSIMPLKIPTIELIEKIQYYKTEVARIKSEKGLA